MRAILIAALCLTTILPLGLGSTPEWKLSGTWPAEIAYTKGSAVVGDDLYVFGGRDVNGDFVQKAFRAQLAADGAIGPWKETTALPYGWEPIGTSHDGFVYALAGPRAGASCNSNSAAVSKVGPGGELGEWKEFDYATADGHATIAFSGAFAYAINGGALGCSGYPQSGTHVGDILPDGTITGWRNLGPNPTVAAASVFVHAGRLYVVGGEIVCCGGEISDRVYAASIRGDGTLSSWSHVGTLPNAKTRGVSLVQGDTFRLFGPVLSPVWDVGEVLEGEMRADGTLGPVSVVGDLPIVEGVQGGRTSTRVVLWNWATWQDPARRVIVEREFEPPVVVRHSPSEGHVYGGGLEVETTQDGVVVVGAVPLRASASDISGIEWIGWEARIEDQWRVVFEGAEGELVLSPGQHEVRPAATDGDGNRGTGAPVKVTVLAAP